MVIPDRDTYERRNWSWQRGKTSRSYQRFNGPYIPVRFWSGTRWVLTIPDTELTLMRARQRLFGDYVISDWGRNLSGIVFRPKLINVSRPKSVRDTAGRLRRQHFSDLCWLFGVSPLIYWRVAYTLSRSNNRWDHVDASPGLEDHSWSLAVNYWHSEHCDTTNWHLKYQLKRQRAIEERLVEPRFEIRALREPIVNVQKS